MKPVFFQLLFMSVIFAHSQSQNDEEFIRKARQESNEAIARRDIPGITKFWLDDFVIIRGNGSIEIGKERGIQSWKEMKEKTPQVYFERTPSEIIISNGNPNIAWESGTWKGFNTYSKGGRYGAQWKKKDGEWKLQAELFVALEK